MDAPRGEPAASRFDELRAEAAESLAYSANSLRAVRDRYRQAWLEDLAQWETLRDDLADFERGPDRVSGAGVRDRAAAGAEAAGIAGDAPAGQVPVGPAAAAEAGAADHRLRTARGDASRAQASLGHHEVELSRLELAIRNLESTWLFLERGDASLVTDEATPIGAELQMRIVEAQEAERARLAQEVHDGPAQALSNAIFQVEFIERVFDTDPRLARTELRFLRELLRRELGDVRGFIGQLRPPVLAKLGLDGSIVDTVTTQAELSGMRIKTDLRAPADRLAEAAQTVVLRIVQEALQNVRKHAGATEAVVATVLDNEDWVLEVRDNGRGFDVGAVAARGRRNFGLQFMRERAELIGARFEVHSRPEAGTVVRLAVPLAQEEIG